MTVALTHGKQWTADEFVVTSQSVFGDAWRYELIDGRVVAQDAPDPEHGAIIAGLAGVLMSRRSAMPGTCRPEVGSAAIPRSVRRNTARIPDVMVRCGSEPRVIFEVVSPSEIRDWRGRDLRRHHHQATEGVREIVELYQRDFAVHVYRLTAGGDWAFEALGGRDAVLRLDSIGLELPLSEIYAVADIAAADLDDAVGR